MSIARGGVPLRIENEYDLYRLYKLYITSVELKYFKNLIENATTNKPGDRVQGIIWSCMAKNAKGEEISDGQRGFFEEVRQFL